MMKRVFRRSFSQINAVNNPNIHDTFMKLALRHAQAAYREKEIPIGAIVVDHNKGVVLSAARSQMEARGDSNAQAEIISVSLAKGILKTHSLTNCSLYTTFEPCRNIFNLVKESKIQRIYYGAKDFENGVFNGPSSIQQEEEDEEEKEVRKNNNIVVVDGLLEVDSKNLLDSFFRARQRESPNHKFISYRGLMKK